ncbi:e3 ubiquitin- ligase ari9 [Trichoderma cornu-damae]|uniref:E3 ubiquitin- ligase ari9 n=1 Tax=Trichoderma cornu-damae TaxID=654480 RepID=A0A9P8QQC3_9HYPO|nr:e3 ubiquitin- ligase ari9 [Trichoderma cornu-damae]
MLRSIKRRTEAALRRRRENRSVGRVTPVNIGWPLRNDSYPEQTAATTDTAEAQGELRPAPEEALLLQVKQDGDAGVVDTAALDAEEPTHQVEFEAAQEPGMDSYAAKYVPFVETSAMRSNMFVNPASSHYGMVNPAIMSGFGDDDDSIWLVDDEETDEEAGNAKRTIEGDDEEEGWEEGEEEGGEEGRRGEEEEEEEDEAEPDVSLPATVQPPPGSTEPETAPTTSPQTGFRYRVNLALLDDDEFTSSLQETGPASVAVDEAPTSYPPSPAVDAHPMGDSLSVASASRHRNGSQDETPASNGSSSTPATSNPYVHLLERQDSAMAVAYQRRLDLSGRRGDDEADDFR